MNTVKYDPFRELRSLQDEMTRLFAGVTPGGSGRDELMNTGAWAPNVDIYENKDHLVLEAELPGMNREDFELTFENNVITLKGERNSKRRQTVTGTIALNVLTALLPGHSRCRRPLLVTEQPRTSITEFCG